MNITANDLKTRGAAIIEEKLKDSTEVFVSLRGERRYVITTIGHYATLREMELTAMLAEAKRDIAAGRFTTSTEEHLAAIRNAL